jgi:nicotinamidase-related amidase
MRPAVLVIDMIWDFVYGKLGFENARKIVPQIAGLLNSARGKGIPVIYVCDSHLPDDPEISLWGEHAMAGSPGSRVIPDLVPGPGEILIEKRTYSAFYGTNLDDVLRRLGVRRVILTGVTTNICVLHTAADAFFRGYKVTVPPECTAAFDGETHLKALETMKSLYGAEIRGSSEITREWG